MVSTVGARADLLGDGQNSERGIVRRNGRPKGVFGESVSSLPPKGLPLKLGFGKGVFSEKSIF